MTALRTHDLLGTRRWCSSKTGDDVTPDGYLFRPVLSCSRCGLEYVDAAPRLLRRDIPSDQWAGYGFVPARLDASATTCDEGVVRMVLSC